MRRKRVLPNLGSASRRRHSSVSKENVEKITDIPEVRHEEIVTTAKDLEHIDVSIVEFSSRQDGHSCCEKVLNNFWLNCNLGFGSKIYLISADRF